MAAEIVIGRSPELLSVTVCAALVVFTSVVPKVSVAGDAVTKMVWPVPLRLTVGADPILLLFTVSVPVRLPRADGVKVTLMVQPAPGSRDEGQVLV